MRFCRALCDTMEKRVARLRDRLRPVVLRNSGFCPICAQRSVFVSRDPWLRDHYKCRRCRSIPRERALTLVLEQRYPNGRELTIDDFEAMSYLL